VVDVDDYLSISVLIYSEEGYPEGADLIGSIEFTPTLLSISPTSGSSAGSWIKVTGTGFGNETTGLNIQDTTTGLEICL
jgi:hypothetical protein